MTIKESIHANVSAVLMAVILIWFSGAIQSQSCPYRPSHPAVFIASPMGSEPGSVAPNAAGLTRLHVQPELLQLL